jgi:predicted membrane protein
MNKKETKIFIYICILGILSFLALMGALPSILTYPIIFAFITSIVYPISYYLKNNIPPNKPL